VRERVPLVCQIFNWSECPEVEGVRLADALRAAGIDAPEFEPELRQQVTG
jgi:hypothetical protein